MASSLAAQLSQVAAKATHQFDLKAQRSAHAQSLIFEKKVASTQDFDTIYQLYYEGFQELCALDPRFQPFRQNLFSEQSKVEDRSQMTAAQNKELDIVIEDFLALVGGRLLLNPAVKAVDWLVRRFRVHEHNTRAIILTFLPYHTTPLFLNLLSILPENLTSTFKVLHPYKRSLILPTRASLVHSASTNKEFFSALNSYVMQVGKARAHYQGLTSFWAGIMTEALSTMLDSAQSGRLEVERRNKEDVLIRILPTLSTGLSLKKAPELVIACYMLCVVLANKGSLSDNAIDSLMEAVAGSWTRDTIASGITCLAVVFQHKEKLQLPKPVAKSILRLEDVVDVFAGLAASNSIVRLLSGLMNVLMENDNEEVAAKCVSLVGQVLQNNIMGAEDKTKTIIALLKTIDESHRKGYMSEEVRQLSSDTLATFIESKELDIVLQRAISESNVDIKALEITLQLAIDNNLGPAETEDVEMEDIPENSTQDEEFAAAITSLSQRRSQQPENFLVESPSPLFSELVVSFTQATTSANKLGQFLSLPILRRNTRFKDLTYFSFLVRYFSGPHPPLARTKAINIVTTSILESNGKAIDLQALIPYAISALSDPSTPVRREAAALLTSIDNQYFIPDIEETPWGLGILYGDNERSKAVQWLPGKDIHTLFDKGFMPSLEECILDPSQVIETFVQTVKGTSEDGSGLKKSVRRDFFSFICSHITNTPLFATKLRLLSIVNRISKIGSTPRTQFLSPMLAQCRTIDSEKIKRISTQEHVSIQELEQQVLSIIYPKDTTAISTLLSLVKDSPQSTRTSFLGAVFERMKDTWPFLDEEKELFASETLLDMCLSTKPQTEDLANSSKELLRSVDLSGPVISKFLSTVTSASFNIDSQSPAPKRRRMSQSNMAAMSPASREEANIPLRRISFILELIDASQPERFPELLGGLFQTLAIVHKLKLQVRSEMSYLLSLNLGILLSIVNKYKGSPKKLDTSVIRADLIIDCVRTSESQQVQNTALLLVAALATVAPEIVLHSVMPIFTFMGSSVLRKDDEYSALVIDQTIDQVIPPLVRSLRVQKRDVVTGTSELLLSFTTAYEHIPSYRRLRLFESLVNKLGQEDFLFAVLAMLATKYGMDRDVLVTMTALASNAEAQLQLTTYARYLSLVQDALQPKPTISRILLGIGSEDGREPHKVAVDLLQTLSHLLKFTSLGNKMVQYFESDDTEDAKKVHSLFSGMLERLLALGESVRSIKAINIACGDALATLLGTLSLVDFIDTIEVLLQRPKDDLRRQVLRLLENRLDNSNDRDAASQSKALSFLSVLVGIVETSPDILLKHAAVACMEKISEKYGKKNPEKVVEAAIVVAGDKCMGLADNRIRIMSALCLASMTEVIADAIIPVLPVALPRSLDLLQSSIQAKEQNPELHDAIYSLLSALFVHIPYMISSEDLDKVLCLSSSSAHASLSEDCNINRQEALQLLAKRVDAKEVYNAVERNWDFSVSNGSKAAKETLEVVKLSIEKHSKSDTIKNVPALSKLLWKVFDFRRAQLNLPASDRFEGHQVDDIESSINDLTIKMIYKLNDTIFRPLFTQLTEWATGELDKSDLPGRQARLTTFYKFLETFFGTLKSIVTGYSSYIIENVVDILKNVRPNVKENQALWTAVMRTLRNSFEHDQDEFWQSPSHLGSISSHLISQLSIANSKASFKLVTAEATPAIVALAIAADSPDNQKELNTHIMKYMRASGGNADSCKGVNPFTRLAAVKCEQSLTEELGEEWLALLPEMLPFISELMEDDDENVEKEVRKWVLMIEDILGEKLDDMLA
ncbi:SnoRNA-binding rRNA-processing protein utp10 [Trichophyton interdigitale]|uniref:U3 small nucleolar RNA-associated protein 10 n=1 Tax=Trichophyton interdigitale TaxID=101480 RepID=A0A9P5D0F2_9EURO|nr:SnoRNA-binding rRNA-processing protein utp10 [Trichophyton interdigitale]KAF3900914.1 SnoRNA-binding rRNA-processing protein utp10 [Trichophyton interdigitale]